MTKGKKHMPRENSSAAASVIERIERARKLLDEAIALAKEGGKGAGKASAIRKPRAAHGAIDFSVPLRAFVKKHVGRMSGAQKFTLLLAYFTKGDAGRRVALAELEKNWNGMTAKGLLGTTFNRMYSARARERDLVHAEKGGYYLRPSWKEIFDER
jgi:hypothetical protein